MSVSVTASAVAPAVAPASTAVSLAAPAASPAFASPTPAALPTRYSAAALTAVQRPLRRRRGRLRCQQRGRSACRRQPSFCAREHQRHVHRLLDRLRGGHVRHQRRRRARLLHRLHAALRKQPRDPVALPTARRRSRVARGGDLGAAGVRRPQRRHEPLRRRRLDSSQRPRLRRRPSRRVPRGVPVRPDVYPRLARDLTRRTHRGSVRPRGPRRHDDRAHVERLGIQ